MMLIKARRLMALALVILPVLSGCDDRSSTATPAAEYDGLSQSQPLRIDAQHHSVTMLVQIDGRFFTEGTRHAAVFNGGSNHGKALFNGYASPQALYDALLAVKAVPGNNMTFANAASTHVAGSALIATLNWKGAAHPRDFNEVVKDSNGKKIDLHFGGNLQAATDKHTGCLICLDSCPVGIISNASYTYGAVEKRGEVTFHGNGDILPPDGTLATLTLIVAD